VVPKLKSLNEAAADRPGMKTAGLPLKPSKLTVKLDPSVTAIGSAVALEANSAAAIIKNPGFIAGPVGFLEATEAARIVQTATYGPQHENQRFCERRALNL
jgi:hypothetical protein